HRADPRAARADRLAVDEHGAGAAPPLAAAVLGPGQIEVVAQDAQQAPVGLRVDAAPGSVDPQLADNRHWTGPPQSSASTPATSRHLSASRSPDRNDRGAAWKPG